jgi:hypothetical protein
MESRNRSGTAVMTKEIAFNTSEGDWGQQLEEID